MIANFFRSLEEHQVEYLLISGQATVLYGAATFSEDIDLWLNPTDGNCGRFTSALRQCEARYYKLTPPLTIENLIAGHGFHFVLPDDDAEAFLDIMGRPPRVGSFAASFQTVRRMDSAWGCLPTIGLQHLVELKKTQRLEDYPIISNLALAWFEQPECARGPADFQWAIANIFTMDALQRFFQQQPASAELLPDAPPSLPLFVAAVREENAAPPHVADDISRWLQERILSLQRADRTYWRGIIEELKHLRARRLLTREGALV